MPTVCLHEKLLMIYEFLFSICGDFEAIKQRALAKPATTAELNEIMKYIDNAKGEKSIQLGRRIKVRFFYFIQKLMLIYIEI